MADDFPDFPPDMPEDIPMDLHAHMHEEPVFDVSDESQYADPSGETIVIKTGPQSVQAEQSLLGSIMLQPEGWFDVADLINDSDFSRKSHQALWQAMQLLSAEGQPLDGVTVAERLKSNGLLEDAGGLPYLAELVDSTPPVNSPIAYARIIRDRSTERQLIKAANKIAEAVQDPNGATTRELVDLAEQEVFNIQDQRTRKEGPVPILGVLEKAISKVQLLYETKGQITGLPTGFTELDDMTAGLQKSDLLIFAGRPSMGKTSLAMNVVEHALMAEQHEGAVLVFSMEMPAESLVMRMLSSLGRIDQSRVRVGDMHDDDWPRLTNAMVLLQDKPLFIDDTPSMTPGDVRARARRIQREHGGLKLIVLDYLQLMQGNTKTDNRTLEISEISRSLKGLAREMDCPVIALSQLNRGLESRTDKRPIMSDLRESGAIEQDADVILFIYRDEVYNPETLDQGVAELIIAKQRNGPIGRVRTAFLGSLTRFENLADDRYQPSAPPGPSGGVH